MTSSLFFLSTINIRVNKGSEKFFKIDTETFGKLIYIRFILFNSVRQHNHFIAQGNYKATCFDYRLVILRPVLSIVSQDAMHTLGSHRVYVHGIHQIESFVSKGVTRKLCLQQWDT